MSTAFRVDASSSIGTGHLMRCLTLADAIKRGGAKTRFISRHLPSHFYQILLEKGHEVVLLSSPSDGIENYDLQHSHWLGVDQGKDAQDTIGALADHRWDWLVVDHYALDHRWEEKLRSVTNNIFVIDDIADRKHNCDVLLDQNYYADMEGRYIGKVPELCQMLLGPKFVLLREEFLNLRPQTSKAPASVKKILVFFGGVDSENHTSIAIGALAQINRSDIEVDVVIGAQHPFIEQIKADCRRLNYRCHVQTPELGNLMRVADLAIGAGGTATWERCCLGLPTITIVLAANQVQLVKDGALAGFIYSPEIEGEIQAWLYRHVSALLENPMLRAHISSQCMKTVDGYGLSRVLQVLRPDEIYLRLATMEDSFNLHMWRNHPSIRAVSRNKDPISIESHEKWLQSVLKDKNKPLLIGFDNASGPLGVVRFDINNAAAEVSIYLVPDLPIRGLGSRLLKSAEQWLRINRPEIKYIYADVLGENVKSHRLFQASGYILDVSHYIKVINSSGKP